MTSQLFLTTSDPYHPLDLATITLSALRALRTQIWFRSLYTTQTYGEFPFHFDTNYRSYRLLKLLHLDHMIHIVNDNRSQLSIWTASNAFNLKMLHRTKHPQTPERDSFCRSHGLTCSRLCSTACINAHTWMFKVQRLEMILVSDSFVSQLLIIVFQTVFHGPPS